MPSSELPPSKPSPDVNALLAENLRRLRAESRWSTRAFAAHAGLSLSALYRIEHLKQQGITLATAEKLAHALGVHLSTLVSHPDLERKAWHQEEGALLVAKAIKHGRARKEWSQAKLAIAAGVPRYVVSQIEMKTHNATLTLLDKLAAALNLTLAELLEPVEA